MCGAMSYFCRWRLVCLSASSRLLRHSHAQEAQPLYPQLRKYLDGAGTAVERQLATFKGLNRAR